MKKSILKINFFGKFPWSIKGGVSREIFFWERNNKEKRNAKYTKLEKEIYYASENPSRFGMALIFLNFLLLVMFYLCPFINPVWVGWQTSEQLTYFSTVWTIQATMVALVYPIVISFVAVYLQRRPTSETFLNLYMLYSGVMAAGVSSLSLLASMGVQYLLISTWGTTYLSGWASLDIVWFLLNLALTTLFLYRTVAFLRPEIQLKVVGRYALNTALVKDVERSLFKFLWTGDLGCVWDGIQLKADANSAMSPSIQIGWSNLHKGAEDCELKIKSNMQLTNVRLWLIRYVVKTWCKEANLWMLKKETNFAPILILNISFEQVYSEKIMLVKVVNGPSLTWFNKFLLRLSFEFSSKKSDKYNISIGDIFMEMVSDVRSSMAKQDYEVFVRSLKNIIEFHKMMLSGSLISNGNCFNSLAMLPNPNSFFFLQGDFMRNGLRFIVIFSVLPLN